MLHWVETHGFECLVAYFGFACLVSALPALPANSGFWATLCYNLMHVFASNLKPMMQKAGLNIPEMAPNSVTVKTEVKQTTVENKTEEAPKP